MDAHEANEQSVRIAQKHLAELAEAASARQAHGTVGVVIQYRGGIATRVRQTVDFAELVEATNAAIAED